MAVVKVQSVTASGGSSAGGAATCSLTGVTAGNTIVEENSYFHGGTATQTAALPSDSNGTFAVGVGPTSNGSNTTASWVGAAINFESSAAAGTHNFSQSAPYTANNGMHVTFTEFSGIATISPVDKTPAASNATTAQTNTSTSTGTLSGANDLVIQCITVTSGAGQTNVGITDPPTNYTSLNVGNNTAAYIAFEHCYRIKSASTTPEQVVYTWTDSTTLFSQLSTLALLAQASTSGNYLLQSNNNGGF